MNYDEIRNVLLTSIGLGNQLIIFDYDNLDVLHLLYKELDSKNIFNVKIWQSIEEKSNSEHAKYVSKEDIDNVINFYRMYDFSDKVFVVSDTDQYGSMFNYVKNGIVSKQEMMDALLYKI